MFNDSTEHTLQFILIGYVYIYIYYIYFFGEAYWKNQVLVRTKGDMRRSQDEKPCYPFDVAELPGVCSFRPQMRRSQDDKPCYPFDPRLENCIDRRMRNLASPCYCKCAE